MLLNMYGNKDKQQGSVLAISLVILLVLTILGVNSMGALVLEEKMAGNTRQSMVASQAAEAALRAAETWIILNVTGHASLAQFGNGSNGLYSRRGSTILPPAWDVFVDRAWTAMPTRSVGLAIANINPVGVKARSLAANPRYIIEYLGKGGAPAINVKALPSVAPHFFRVTAIGWGESTNARFIAQSTIRVNL